jgi:hypothetical protein
MEGWDMKIVSLVLSVYLATCCGAFAQTSAGSSTGSAGGAAGSSLSSGGTINGTGGSPGPNTSNALKRTTGNDLGAPQTGAGSAQASHGNAVDTPAANRAAQNLGNTDTGILKK